ncbi:MAG TPA: helix-turn-helix transcriptional regulator [Jiangellales bacterium]|nr:helix-turn-helix transcriptional regulator [Jiangellales bacterium]
MPSWTNATGSGTAELDATAGTKGVLRPEETTRLADLRRDHPVDPALQPFVERYWSVRWDLTGRPPFRSEVLSHPSVNVSVESGTHDRFGFALPEVLVHGVVTRRFSVDLTGAGRVTAVKFRPGGFRAFTGWQPARNSVTRLHPLPGVAPERVVADVLAVRDDADRAAVLDQALAPFAPEPEPAYLELLGLQARMLHDRALVRVEDVAAVAGTSVRSVQRLFAAYVGVGPKAVLARYRLQDAVAAIDAGEVDDLADLAHSLGYFDQAHFARDFRAVVGTTPSAYLRQARPTG